MNIPSPQPENLQPDEPDQRDVSGFLPEADALPEPGYLSLEPETVGRLSITPVSPGGSEAFLNQLLGRTPVSPSSPAPGRARAPENLKLEVELIPRPLWGRSIARQYPQQWEKLRRECYRKAGYRCEICGGRGSAHPVEAHESWTYVDTGGPRIKLGIQTLWGLIALCPKCHACKHLGRSGAVLSPAAFEELLDHFCQVNGWGGGDNARRMLNEYLAAAGAEWERRNGIEWHQRLEPFLQA